MCLASLFESLRIPEAFDLSFVCSSIADKKALLVKRGLYCLRSVGLDIRFAFLVSNFLVMITVGTSLQNGKLFRTIMKLIKKCKQSQ